MPGGGDGGHRAGYSTTADENVTGQSWIIRHGRAY
jgi:hypothetical protein